MSTSSRNVFFEAAAAAALAATAVALWSPGDVWLTHVGFHPMWIVVLVLAAHYGSLGLFLSLGLSVGALAVAAMATGGNMDGLSLRATNTSDVFALAASLAVAWLAMLQERKIARLNQQVVQADEQRPQHHDHEGHPEQRLPMGREEDGRGRLLRHVHHAPEEVEQRHLDQCHGQAHQQRGGEYLPYLAEVIRVETHDALRRRAIRRLAEDVDEGFEPAEDHAGIVGQPS